MNLPSFVAVMSTQNPESLSVNTFVLSELLEASIFAQRTLKGLWFLSASV